MKKHLLLLGFWALVLHSAFAQSHTKKYEMFSIIGAVLFIFAFVGGLYYYYTHKKKEGKSGEKYIVKTIETYKNGRKIVMTKKYRVVQDEEFPNELKRSTRK